MTNYGGQIWLILYIVLGWKMNLAAPHKIMILIKVTKSTRVVKNISQVLKPGLPGSAEKKMNNSRYYSIFPIPKLVYAG